VAIVRRHKRRLFQKGRRLTHDVLIVGAGPAGSACALALARAGFDTAIIEKKSFPRTKACGEYLNSGTVRRIDELGMTEAVAPHAATLRGARISSSGITVELPFASPAWSVPRRTLDEVLLRAACAAGAKLLPGRADRVVDEAGRATVEFTDSNGARRMTARIVVGADGMHSIVAPAIANRVAAEKHRLFALGGHYDGFEPLKECIEIYVGRGTYAARNPLGERSANVIVALPPALLRTWRGDVEASFREHATRTSGGRWNLTTVTPCSERVASPLTLALRPMIGRSVLVIGDAAAFVDPFIGQGIFLAFGSAARAAKAIGNILLGRQDSRVALRSYAREHRAEILERRRLALIVRAAVSVPLLTRRAAATIKRAPDRARAVLDAVAGLAPAGPVLEPLAVARLFA
jgi:menaquinone-9 beta-reductase